MINRKTKQILEYKQTSDSSEMYYEEMKTVLEKQHTPIMVVLIALSEEGGKYY